jgi:hypothetical protein
MFQLGSVSTGTLKTEDLLPAFTSIMRQFLTDNNHNAIYVERAETIVRNDFYDMELANELVGTLMDGIQGYCPPFVYFGARVDDGADFGFWVDHEGLDDARYEARLSGDPIDGDTQELDGVLVQVSDHGNITLMDLDRNVIWSVV